MQRRSMLLLTPKLSLAILLTHRKAWAFGPSQSIHLREQAQGSKQLSANVKTPNDARMLVDFVASLFCDSLPPAWVSNSTRKSIAHAEFAAVSDPHQLIPEWRVAQAWNTYADIIGAPLERHVTVAEIHNLRDGLLTSASLGWERGDETIWQVSTIYATQLDGTIASGCRAIETIRILWDLSRFPENLVSVRRRVSEGVLNSDLLRTGQVSRAKTYVVPTTRGPIYAVEREYVTTNSNAALQSCRCDAQASA